MTYFIALTIAMIAVGFTIGVTQRDEKMHKLCESQFQRGNYWFDKYMMEVDKEWQPLTKDF